MPKHRRRTEPIYRSRLKVKLRMEFRFSKGFMKKSIALLFALFAVSGAMAQQNITSPEAAFGFKPGTDRKLADWNELTAYFKKLGAESDRIRYEELGKTTEGRPFIAVTISSADNLAHLDRY